MEWAELNVKVVMLFTFCFLGGIAALIILGGDPIEIFVSIALLVFIFLIIFSIGYSIDKLCP